MPVHNHDVPNGSQMQASHLEAALIHRVADGDCSAATLQSLSHSSYLDSGSASLLSHIGCAGQHKQNFERDIHRRVRQTSPLLKALDLYEFNVPVLKDGGLGVDQRPCALLLPSDIFSAFYKLDKALFRKTFVGSEDALRRYWSAFRQLSHFERHPFKDAIIQSPEKCIPAQFWGDDSDLSKTQSFQACTIASAVVRESVLTCKLLIGVLALENTYADSLDQWYSAIVWDFWNAGRGVHAARDHKGMPFPAKSKRAQQVDSLDEGKLLADGYRLIFTEALGDWKFKRDAWRFHRHYGKSGAMCMECNATVRGPQRYTNFTDCPWTASTHEDYLASFGGAQVPALATLPGYDVVESSMGDLMHEGALGVAQTTIGSAMVELLLENWWQAPAGGEWRVRATVQLRTAYRDYKDFCRTNGIEQSQPKFTLGRLNITTSLVNNEPLFKAKAANTMVVLRWLSTVCNEAVRAIGTRPHRLRWQSPQHTRDRATAIWALADTWHTVRQAEEWMAEEDSQRMLDSASIFLRKSIVLAADSQAAQNKRWPCKPKLHAFYHTVSRAFRTRRNPCTHYCFPYESHIGTIKKIVKRCHKRTVSKRCLQRNVLRWVGV